MVGADPALILVERHVQRPVLAILDRPVVADQFRQLLAALGLEAADVVASGHRGLRVGVLAADRLHHDDAGQLLPLPPTLEPAQFAGGSELAGVDSARPLRHVLLTRVGMSA